MKFLLGRRPNEATVLRLAGEVADGKYMQKLVDMTPDATVVWREHEVSEIGGTLYLPDDYDSGVLYTLINSVVNERVGRKAGRGNNGLTRVVGSVAVKKFNRDSAPEDSGLPALRASVTFSEGLSRVDSTIGMWHVVAPRQLGAFIPHEGGGSVWAMSREDSNRPRASVSHPGERLPDNGLRVELYRRAVAACGADPTSIGYDDRVDNLGVRTLPTPPTAQQPEQLGELVKYDVRAITPGLS